MRKLYEVSKWAGFAVMLFLMSGCYMFRETNNPFDPRPPQSQTGPIALYRQRCIDAGDAWNRDTLQCRAVAPWKKSR